MTYADLSSWIQIIGVLALIPAFIVWQINWQIALIYYGFIFFVLFFVFLK